MQYSQEHLKTMVYAEFGGQTECIMGNWKIENRLLALRGHVTNASFKQGVGILLMPKIDRARKTYLSPEI